VDAESDGGEKGIGKRKSGDNHPQDVSVKKLKKLATKKAEQHIADDAEDAYLHGFSTDEDDSSDEDDDDVMNNEPSALDVGKLPTIAKDDAIVKQRLEKAKRQPVCAMYTHCLVAELNVAMQTNQRGVLYISHIPHGFYEDQMKSYFSQFGEVTRLRLSRNRKVCFHEQSDVGVFDLYSLRLVTRSITHSSNLNPPRSPKSLPRQWTTICSRAISSNAR